MAAITKETYKANGIEVITDKLGKLWLNERRIEKNQDIKIYEQLQTNMIRNIKNKDMT